MAGISFTIRVAWWRHQEQLNPTMATSCNANNHSFSEIYILIDNNWIPPRSCCAACRPETFVLPLMAETRSTRAARKRKHEEYVDEGENEESDSFSDSETSPKSSRKRQRKSNSSKSELTLLTREELLQLSSAYVVPLFHLRVLLILVYCSTNFIHKYFHFHIWYRLFTVEVPMKRSPAIHLLFER